MLVGWLVAVLIRLATGSATVATVTASGILAPLVSTVEPTRVSLVKEYFGMSVTQTVKTWSIMETLISVVGLVFVLLASLVR